MTSIGVGGTTLQQTCRVIKPVESVAALMIEVSAMLSAEK